LRSPDSGRPHMTSLSQNRTPPRKPNPFNPLLYGPVLSWTAVFRNRFMNTFTPLSVQPIHGGPTYLFRNIIVNVAGEQLKLHALAVTPPQEPSGVLVYHNTFVSPPNIELGLYTTATSHYFEIENNLFIAPSTSGPQAADWEGVINHGTFDYNGYFPDGSFRFNNPLYGGYFYQPNFAGLQSLGMERNGILAGGTLFANLTVPSTYTVQVPPADASLASGSIALDRGRVIPNVNDAYQGSGPDLGALELGCPLPTYGPRAEGLDESNEVVGCSATSTSITSVSVTPSPVTLSASQTQQFTATTLPSAGAVTWKLSPSRGSITAGGLYSAPPDALLGEVVTVTAVSTSNTAVSGSATVKLTAPVSLALSPLSATLNGLQTQQFAASVAGAVDKSVSWILQPAIGSITIAGLFTAPPATSSTQLFKLTAVSSADSTKTAEANITVSPAPTSMTITPAVSSLKFGTTQQFLASSSASWSISPLFGSISPSTGLYTAPKSGRTTQVTVTAIGLVNTSVKTTVIFTVQK